MKILREEYPMWGCMKHKRKCRKVAKRVLRAKFKKYLMELIREEEMDHHTNHGGRSLTGKAPVCETGMM